MEALGSKGKVVELYELLLDDLDLPSERQIKELTALAVHNSQYAAPISTLIVKHMEDFPAFNLTFIFLIDSILCASFAHPAIEDYSPFFEQSIIFHFAELFRTAHKKVRGQLFEIRKKWSDKFDIDVLHRLDVEVNKWDAGWPIITKQPSRVTRKRNASGSGAQDDDGYNKSPDSPPPAKRRNVNRLTNIPWSEGEGCNVWTPPMTSPVRIGSIADNKPANKKSEDNKAAVNKPAPFEITSPIKRGDEWQAKTPLPEQVAIPW